MRHLRRDRNLSKHQSEVSFTRHPEHRGSGSHRVRRAYHRASRAATRLAIRKGTHGAERGSDVAFGEEGGAA